MSLYFTMGAPFPKITPSHGRSGSPSNTRFLWPARAHKANGISIGSAVFAHMTPECPILYSGTPLSPLKIAHSHWEIWTPIKYVVPGAYPSPNPNGISIGSAVLAGLTNVTNRPTNRPTDHAIYSVGNYRPCLRT